jgi:hypothetical protein
MFGVGISLAGSTTYEIEIMGQASFTTNTAVACSVSSIWAFTNTPTSAAGSLFGGAYAGTASNFAYAGSPLTALIYTSPATAAVYNVNFVIKGLVRTNAATTYTPQVILSGANTSAFSVTTNSFVKVTALGTNVVTGSGAWA